MKKLYLILSVIIISIFNISNASSETYYKYGTGDLQLSDYTVNGFITYIRGEKGKSPNDFFVTTDGSSYHYWYCSYGQGNCMEGNIKEDTKACERQTGKICKKFALKRIIKWKNDINPGKGKKSKIYSKWSDAEIRQKLTELGFYNN